MNIYINPNITRKNQLSNAKDLILTLEKYGHTCYLGKEESIAIFSNLDRVNDPVNSDLIVSIGGDGTVLRASKIAIETNKKLLGINSGRLGYLCAVDYKTVINNPDKLFDDLYESERTMLEVIYNGKKYIALNDIVLSRFNMGSTITLDVTSSQINNVRWRGDGIIVSTPTGSTSYSYAAGGPFVDPGLHALIVTPICPHYGSNKSIILHDNDTIYIDPVNNQDDSVCLYVDGVNIGLVNETLSISKADRKLILLSNKNTYNYNKIRQ